MNLSYASPLRSVEATVLGDDRAFRSWTTPLGVGLALTQDHKAAVRAQVERDDWGTFAALHKRLAGDARKATEIVLRPMAGVLAEEPDPA